MPPPVESPFVTQGAGSCLGRYRTPYCGSEGQTQCFAQMLWLYSICTQYTVFYASTVGSPVHSTLCPQFQYSSVVIYEYQQWDASYM